jgi:hypothetical protein
MNVRTIFAAGAMALVLVLAVAPGANAGGIVYWGGTRVISTGTPVVAAPATTAHVAGKAYETGYQEGYQDGYNDGVRTETSRTVVTRTIVTPTYTVPTRTVYTYTAPTVVYRSAPIIRVPYVRTVPFRPTWHRVHRVYRGHFGHRPHCRPGSGIVIRW